MDLSIIIVSYNTKDLLVDCISSVYRSTDGLDFEILVIDNASADGSAAEVKAKFPGVRVVSNQVNRGFAAASNQGMQLMRGEYALLLNPDSQVPSRSLAKMVRYLEENQSVGIIGCKVLNPDGTLQPSAFPLPRLKDLVLSGFAVGWAPWGRRLQRLCSRPYLPRKGPVEVGWVSGSCLMIRRETIDRIGLLDENFFLYSEDVDWCIRAKREGWAVVYYPDAAVVHHGGQSAEQNLALKISAFYGKRLYFGRKHFGRLAHLILRLASCFELATKWIVVAGVLKLDSDEKRARLQGYRQALGVVFGKTPKAGDPLTSDSPKAP